MEDELCNGIKLILKNLPDYPALPDMIEVRNEFRLNGWSNKVEESKENVRTSPDIQRDYDLLYSPMDSNFFKQNILGANTKCNKPKIQLQICVFCQNNKEPQSVYSTHSVRDALGRVICPKLRKYTCPLCGANGDKAHTVRYCDQKPVFTMHETLTLRTSKSRFDLFGTHQRVRM